MSKCQGAITVMMLITCLHTGACVSMPADREKTKSQTFSHGGIIRADTSQKRIALIFTGGDFGEGTAHILDVLKARHIKASLFVTGDFLRKPDYSALIQ